MFTDNLNKMLKIFLPKLSLVKLNGTRVSGKPDG